MTGEWHLSTNQQRAGSNHALIVQVPFDKRSKIITRVIVRVDYVADMIEMGRAARNGDICPDRVEYLMSSCLLVSVRGLSGPSTDVAEHFAGEGLFQFRLGVDLC